LLKLPESQKLQDSYTNTDKKQTQKEKEREREREREREVDMAVKGLMMHQKLIGIGMC